MELFELVNRVEERFLVRVTNYIHRKVSPTREESLMIIGFIADIQKSGFNYLGFSQKSVQQLWHQIDKYPVINSFLNSVYYETFLPFTRDERIQFIDQMASIYSTLDSPSDRRPSNEYAAMGQGYIKDSPSHGTVYSYLTMNPWLVTIILLNGIGLDAETYDNAIATPKPFKRGAILHD